MGRCAAASGAAPRLWRRRSAASTGAAERADRQQRLARGVDVSRRRGDVFRRTDRRLSGFSYRQPGLTAVNTMILLASAVTMRIGVRANRRGERPLLIRLLSWTAAAGTVFLLIQGYE